MGDTLFDGNGNVVDVDTVKVQRRCYVPYSQKRYHL